MKSRRSKWVSGIGAVGLALGGLVLAGWGSGATPAGAQASPTDLPSASRFVVLASFANAAVQDNETGLVWETVPVKATSGWKTASGSCVNKSVGGHKGWRLPTVKELASLVDPSVFPPPTLPAGHPFRNVESAGYWTASAHEDFPTNAWDVNFDIGLVGNDFKVNSNHVWCVRDDVKAD